MYQININLHQMSVCYYQMNTNNFSQRAVERYRFIDKKLMAFYINADKLLDIIKNILSDFCNASVIGYDKRMNKYWCKIYEKKYCTLHVELEILKYNNELSFINLVPLIGTDKLIEEFVLNFKESTQLYTTSSFIRSCLEGYRGL